MIEIKRMDASHIDGVLEIENTCFDEPWSRKSIEEQLSNPNAHYFVLTENGKVAAYGGIWQILDECDINNIGVLEDKRRKGYGGQILEALIDYMQKEELTCINLEVKTTNYPAIALYKKYGFYENELRKKYYRGTEDALILRRDRVEHSGN